MVDREDKKADPLEHYNEHYAGLTRGKLQQADKVLYGLILKKGLIEKIPKKITEYSTDPIGYYKKYYNGLTRGKLATANKKFYHFLRRNGLLEKIPVKQKSEKKDFGEDLLKYYYKHHDGLTRTELAKVNQALYQRMRIDGSIISVPSKWKKHNPGKDVF